MNFDRYLATHYPLFHRASVTKRRLLTLLGILFIIEVAFGQMYRNNLIPGYIHSIASSIIIAPPMFFINYKLFRIARKNRRNKSPEIKRSFSLKNIYSCLLATACLLMLAIPGILFIGLEMASKKKLWLYDYAKFAGLWTRTAASMNSTCNCLIFYWKNKILRKEGMKLFKHMKIRPRFRSQSNK